MGSNTMPEPTESAPASGNAAIDAAVAEMRADYLAQDLPQMLGDLRKLIAARDAEQVKVRRLAHQLRGNAGCFGLHAISAEAERMETLASAPAGAADWGAIDTSYTRIEELGQKAIEG